MSDPIYEAQAYEIAKMARSISALEAENAKLRQQLVDVTESMGRVEERCAKMRELARRLLTEYRYMRSRPRRVYLEHERRMRVIEDEMRELGIEVGE